MTPETILDRSRAVAYRYYRRFAYSSYPLEDMQQDAAVGIIEKGNAAWGVIDGLRAWYGGRKFTNPIILPMDSLVEDSEVRRFSEFLVDPNANSEDSYLAKENADNLWNIVGSLLPSDNLIFRLRYEDGKSDREIAAILDTDIHTVENRTYWAKKRLRRRLM